MTEPIASRRISVIIPTYNRADMVVKCVTSVLEADWENLEVIVVDDCSTDATQETMAAAFGEDCHVVCIKNKQNSLSAYSRNHGASIATGDYLFFLDDDNIVHKDIFIELLASFDRHPEAGLVAPITGNYSRGRLRVWTIGSYFNPWTSMGRDVRPLPEFVEDIPSDILDYPTRYSPNAFMVSRAAFNAARGFDEVMRMQFDESDFGYRVCEAGFSAFIAARAITEHHGYLDPDTTPVLRGMGIGRPERAFAFGRNRTIFARRHFSFLQALSVAFAFAPLSAVYYGWVALRNHRADIAWAYIKGSFAGTFGIYDRKYICKAQAIKPYSASQVN